jgi:protein-S-isoprenylcysteine O-methyltransferase Ste14
MQKIKQWAPTGQGLAAVALGLVNGAVYIFSVVLMIRGLYYGLHCGYGTASGVWRWIANFSLLVQFPILHSYLASERGHGLLKRLSPHPFEVSTIFTLIAGLQLAFVFLAWSPSSSTLWEPHGALRVLLSLLYVGGWMLLGKAIFDAGFLFQTGILGWLAVVTGEKPKYPGMPNKGLFRCCRQPIYLAFLCTLWTSPVWTADHLFLAVLWSCYCLAAPLLKEARYTKYFGQDFAEYQKSTPYFFPRLFGSKKLRE